MVLLSDSRCKLAVLDIDTVWDGLASSELMPMLRLLSSLPLASWPVLDISTVRCLSARQVSLCRRC